MLVERWHMSFVFIALIERPLVLETTYCVFKLRTTRQQHIHDFIIKQHHCDRSIIRLQALKLRRVELLVAHFHLQTLKKRSKSVDTSMYVESFKRHRKI